MNVDEQKKLNRRAAWKWGSFVVGLLGLQVAGGIFAIILATSDESVAVVPNYHEKALNWDSEVAARVASDALGWRCDVSQIDDATPGAGLRVMLVDRDGESVDVESGELRYYRHIRAGDVKVVPIPAGTFSLMELNDCFNSEGLWQVMMNLKSKDGENYLLSRELNVRGAKTGDSPAAAQ